MTAPYTRPRTNLSHQPLPLRVHLAAPERIVPRNPLPRMGSGIFTPRKAKIIWSRPRNPRHGPRVPQHGPKTRPDAGQVLVKNWFTASRDCGHPKRPAAESYSRLPRSLIEAMRSRWRTHSARKDFRPLLPFRRRTGSTAYRWDRIAVSMPPNPLAVRWRLLASDRLSNAE